MAHDPHICTAPAAVAHNCGAAAAHPHARRPRRPLHGRSMAPHAQPRRAQPPGAAAAAARRASGGGLRRRRGWGRAAHAHALRGGAVRGPRAARATAGTARPPLLPPTPPRAPQGKAGGPLHARVRCRRCRRAGQAIRGACVRARAAMSMPAGARPQTSRKTARRPHGTSRERGRSVRGRGASARGGGGAVRREPCRTIGGASSTRSCCNR